MLRFAFLLNFMCFSVLSYSSTSPPFVSVNSDDLQINQFITSDCDGYKSFLLHKKVLYIGGRGTLHRQNPANISESLGKKFSWSVDNNQMKECLSLPQGNADTCHNYIRIIQPYNTTHLLLCGSMALRSTNTFIDRETGYLRSGPGIESPLCSYSPSDPVTSVMGTENDSATIAATCRPRPQTQMGIVKNLPHSYSLRTSQGKGEMINGNPTFAFSFRADDVRSGHVMNKLYFLFGESVDQQYNRQNFGTWVAQVCANDQGDPWNQAWTSFLKVPLLCQTDENDPFEFNTVTHGVINNGVLYGTFNIMSSIIGTAAVCAFRISDIQEAFRTRRFWSLSQAGEYQITSSNIPQDPDPGDCAYPGMGGVVNATSWDFKPDFTYFMKNHPVVASSVMPVHPLKHSIKSGPLLTREKETFTQIQVETVVDVSRRKHNIIFIGTKSGKIIKFLSLLKDGRAEDLQLAEYKLGTEAVTGLLLSPEHNQMYVQTASKVEQVSTANCDIYTKSCSFCDACRMCVASRDPMCAWDGKRCTDDFSSMTLVQNVTHASVSVCGNLRVDAYSMKIPQFGSAVILGKPVTSPTITVQWFNETKCGELPTTEGLKTSKTARYQITPDHRLEINPFTEHDVKSTFIAQYEINGEVIGRSQISFPSTPAIPPPKTTTTPAKIPRTTIKPTTVPEVSRSLSNGSNSTSSMLLPPTPEPSTASSYGLGIAIGVILLLFILLLAAIVFFRNRTQGKRDVSSLETANSNASTSLERNYKLTEPQVKSNEIDLKNSMMDGRCDGKVFMAESDANCGNPETDSLLPSDDMRCIDESPSTPSAAVDLRSGYQRTTPRRAKSIAASDIMIRIPGDKSLKYNSIRRHTKRGTYFIEVDPGEIEIDCGNGDVEMSNLYSGDYEKLAGTQSTEDITAMQDEALSKEQDLSLSSISLGFGDIFKKANEKLNSSAPADELPSAESTPRQFNVDEKLPKDKLLSSAYNSKFRTLGQTPRDTGHLKHNDTNHRHVSSDSRGEGSSSTSSNGSSDKYDTAPSSPTQTADNPYTIKAYS